MKNPVLSRNEVTRPLSASEAMEEAVFDVIERELAIPRTRIHKEDDLVRDLKIDTDDLSFLFVPGLEKRLGKKIPGAEWEKVFTVQDAIDCLVRHIKVAG